MHRARVMLLPAVLLASLSIALSAQSLARDAYSVSLLGKKWALLIDLPGFAVERYGGDSMILYNPQKDARVVMGVEQRSRGVTSAQCRDLFLSEIRMNAKYPLRAINLFERAPFAFAAFVTTDPAAPPRALRYLNASLARDGVCSDLQVRRPAQDAPDAASLLPFLATARLEENPPSGSFDLLRQGEVEFYKAEPSFNKEDYKRAIQMYEKALEMESATPRMDKASWRLLTNHLGIAYERTGDAQTALEIFQGAVRKDPGDPIFLYNLARTYARAKDLADALDNLQKAFAVKDRLPAGERMPDPRTDPDFSAFATEAAFQQQLQALAGYLDHYEFPVPGGGLKLTIELPRFSPSGDSENGTSVFSREEKDQPLRAAITLTAGESATPEACLQSLQDFQQQVSGVFVRPYQAGSIAMMEYSGEPDSSGGQYRRVLLICQPAHTAYLFLEFSREGNFSQADRDLITQILNSIRVVEATPVPKSK